MAATREFVWMSTFVAVTYGAFVVLTVCGVVLNPSFFVAAVLMFAAATVAWIAMVDEVGLLLIEWTWYVLVCSWYGHVPRMEAMDLLEPCERCKT